MCCPGWGPSPFLPHLPVNFGHVSLTQCNQGGRARGGAFEPVPPATDGSAAPRSTQTPELSTLARVYPLEKGHKCFLPRVFLALLTEW